MPQPITDAAFAFPHAAPRLDDPALPAHLADLAKPPRISGWHNIVILAVFALAGLYGLTALIPNPLLHATHGAIALPLLLFPVIALVGSFYLWLFHSISASARLYAAIVTQPERFTVQQASITRKTFNMQTDLFLGFRGSSQSRFFFTPDGGPHTYVSPYFFFGLLQDVRKGDRLYIAVDTEGKQQPTFLGFFYRDGMDSAMQLAQKRAAKLSD